MPHPTITGSIDATAVAGDAAGMILHSIATGAGRRHILLLHGLFGAARNLGAIARGLAPLGAVLSLDLRNHGDSPHGAAMDYPTLAQDIAATMAAAAIPRAVIIGHSMGGKAAMALALAQPALVEKLAVLDIAPVQYDHHYGDYIRAMQAIALNPALTRHAADAALTAAVPEAPIRAFLLNNLILGDSPRWRLDLAALAAGMPDILGWQDPPGSHPYAGPTLFLRGANSDYVTPAASAAITARFPAAVQQSIANTAHWLHAEQPAAVIAALTEFLQS